MTTQYHKQAAYFDFTADRTVYTPLNSIRKEKSICFIYQPEKPRRCPTIGCETLAIVKHHCPNVHIYTYGSTSPPQFSFEHTDLGILSLSECNKLYNQCQVGLCLSSSNPSRIPFEMMAAGLPVVDFFGDNTIFDMPDGAVLLAEKTPESLASAILAILNSNSLQHSMRNTALTFMDKRPADLEFEQFAAILKKIIKKEQLNTEKIIPLYSAAAHCTRLSLPDIQSKNKLPKVMEGKNKQSTITENRKKTIKHRFTNNRISRLLKVLIRGYY